MFVIPVRKSTGLGKFYNRVGGEKMVEVQKANIGDISTPFLNRKIVQDKNVKKVKIKTEAKLVDTEFEGKPQGQRLECIASTQVEEPKEVKWQMNPTTQNYMIDKYGSDTKDWIGLEIDLAVKQAGGAAAAVYPRDCSLEKVIA